MFPYHTDRLDVVMNQGHTRARERPGERTVKLYLWTAFLRTVAVLAGTFTATAGFASGSEPPREADQPPVHHDRPGSDSTLLGCAGNAAAIRTPNLDRLAAGGVRFTKAYTCCPVCVPARTSILTGRSLESNKVTSNNDLRPDRRAELFHV